MATLYQDKRANASIDAPEKGAVLRLEPIREIDESCISAAVIEDRPFIVRRWIGRTNGWSLADSNWALYKGDVTVVPGDARTVATASYVLRRKGITHEMSFRELFDRITANGYWPPILDRNERYYMFGGKVPRKLLDSLPWPTDLKFVGASPYVASSGVVAKAHYDHWYAFLVQLHGSKTVKMFPPSDYAFIYPQHGLDAEKPRRALIELDQPDFERFPLLNKLHGQVALLEAGDLLYMPVNWWHEVTTQGFSVGLNRRLTRSASDWAKALLTFSYHLFRGGYEGGILPIHLHEIKSMAKLAFAAWEGETGLSDQEQWRSFLSDVSPGLCASAGLPQDFGVLLCRWLRTGQEITAQEFGSLEPSSKFLE